MGQGASHPKGVMGLPRSQRQDELLKIYPIPGRVIHRPKTNADGSEIEMIPNCDFEFPSYSCERWMKMLHEAMIGNRYTDTEAEYQDLVRHYCGIELDLRASENVSAKLATNSYVGCLIQRCVNLLSDVEGDDCVRPDPSKPLPEGHAIASLAYYGGKDGEPVRIYRTSSYCCSHGLNCLWPAGGTCIALASGLHTKGYGGVL